MLAFGTVASDGSIIGGSGNFTVDHSATGTYDITLDTPTPGQSQMSAIANGNSGRIATDGAFPVDPGSTGFEVYVQTGATGALINSEFGFIIVGASS